MTVSLQKPTFIESKGLWRAGYMCDLAICRVPTPKGQYKKKRHWVYAKLRRQLQDSAAQHYHDHPNTTMVTKSLEKILGRSINKVTFEMMNEEVLDEYCKKDDDNQGTIQYQENAFVETKKGANWVPPFWTYFYQNISEDQVFEWYLKLQDYMLQNQNYHGVAYKSGKFKQIDDAIRRVSEHAVLVHNLKPIHAERTRILATKIKQNLNANHRTVHGERKFNPQHVANMIALVDRISTYEDERYRLLSNFLKTSICLCTRAGETCGIQMSDVHFGQNGQHTMVDISRQTQYHYKSRKVVESGKKTGIVSKRTKGRRERVTPVTDKNVERWLHGVAVEFATGERGPDKFGNESIWQNENGKPFTPVDIRTKLDRFCKRYEQRYLDEYGHDTKGYSLHSLRHAGASYLQAQTNDIVLVKNILGHSNISITADRYGHATAQQMLKAPDMTSILGGDK